MKASGVAYAKLAILYYAHDLQRRVGDGIGVAVFEPGWMPGTGLGPLISGPGENISSSRSLASGRRFMR
jgi:hypothetical protein